MLRFQELDPSVTGQVGEAVYRDKKSRCISKEEYLESKRKPREKPREKKLESCKGLAQRREAKARLQELELEKDKPFARSRDDPELEKMPPKGRLRWGGPIINFSLQHWSVRMDDRLQLLACLRTDSKAKSRTDVT